MPEIHLTFCADDEDLCLAWETAFDGVAGVRVIADSAAAFLSEAAIVPINSFGAVELDLRGTVAAQIGEYLFDDIETLVRNRHEGEMVVGTADMMATLSTTCALIIPTAVRRAPADSPATLAPYLAFRAALLVARQFASLHGTLRNVGVPPLAATRGSHTEAAQQMRAAYNHVLLGAQPYLKDRIAAMPSLEFRTWKAGNES